MIAFILILSAFIAVCCVLGWVAAIVEDKMEKREARRKNERRKA